MPSFSSSPHSPSSPHRPSPSSLGPPSPIVLISEPTGLVVNSVRDLPNGDVSLFSRLLAFAFAASSSLPLLMPLSFLLSLLSFLFSPSFPSGTGNHSSSMVAPTLTRKTPFTGTTGISRSSWSTRAPTYLLPTHVLPTHLVPTHLLPTHLLATSAHPQTPSLLASFTLPCLTPSSSPIPACLVSHASLSPSSPFSPFLPLSPSFLRIPSPLTSPLQT
jgi:hypothetical protein